MLEFEDYLECIKLPEKPIEITEIQRNLVDVLSFGERSRSVWCARSGITTAILIRMMYETAILKRHCVYFTPYGGNDRRRTSREFAEMFNSTFQGTEHHLSLSDNTNNFRVNDMTNVIFREMHTDDFRGYKWDSAFFDIPHTDKDINRWMMAIESVARLSVLGTTMSLSKTHRRGHIHIIYHQV